MPSSLVFGSQHSPLWFTTRNFIPNAVWNWW